MQRRPSVVVGSIDVAAGKQQELEPFQITAAGQLAQFATCLHLVKAERRATLDEKSADLVMCVAHSICQRRPPPSIERIEIRAGPVDENLDYMHVALACCKVQARSCAARPRLEL